jgi:hypothetical protein
MRNQQDLERRGARFVRAETDRFMESILTGTFKEDVVTATTPAIHARYSRVPPEFQNLHMRLWLSPRGQEIIDKSDESVPCMWRKPVGFYAGKHPDLTLLFIWYMPHCIVIGLDGPHRDSVLAYCEDQGCVFHSRTLYTDEEIQSFEDHYGKVVYLANFVNP